MPVSKRSAEVSVRVTFVVQSSEGSMRQTAAHIFIVVVASSEKGNARRFPIALRLRDTISELHQKGTAVMRIARILGIDVIIHPSLLFVFAFVTWWLSSDGGPLRYLGLSPFQRIVLGTLGALLLWFSVLLHDLTHALAARRSGLSVHQIGLSVFGEVSSVDESRNAAGSAWISLLGPVVNFALAGVFFAFVAWPALSTPLTTMFRYVASANVALGIFNLLPAYPLDAGHALHALLLRRTGDRMRASIISARIGRVVALLLMSFGVFESFTVGFGNGLWIAFVGWFLLQAAGMQELQARIARLLDGHSVAEVASAPDKPLPADATAADALAAILQSGNGAIPVTLGGRCLGVIRQEDFSKLVGSDYQSTYATALMTRIEDVERVAPAASATDALVRLKQCGRSVIAVMDSDNNVVGFFGRNGVLRWLAVHVQGTALPPVR
jgi:Zn-dependent protease